MASDKSISRARRIGNLLLNILTYLFFAICILALVLSITAKRDADGAVNLKGHQMRVVLSDSMAACPETDVSGYEIGDIPLRSMIFIELVPEDEAAAADWYASLRVGDVLTFRYVYVTQETITHRITSITPKEDGYIIILEGDNKAADADTLIQTVDTTQADSPNYILGRVTGQSYPLGLLATAAKSPVGIICIIIVPSLIIMVFEIIRLVGALTEDRRKRERRRVIEQEAELEALKRRLAELEETAAPPDGEAPPEKTTTEPTDPGKETE